MRFLQSLALLIAVFIIGLAGLEPSSAVGTDGLKAPAKEATVSCAIPQNAGIAASTLRYSPAASSCDTGGTKVATCYCREFRKVCVSFFRNVCQRWLDECADKYCDPE